MCPYLTTAHARARSHTCIPALCNKNLVSIAFNPLQQLNLEAKQTLLLKPLLQLWDWRGRDAGEREGEDGNKRMPEGDKDDLTMQREKQLKKIEKNQAVKKGELRKCVS